MGGLIFLEKERKKERSLGVVSRYAVIFSGDGLLLGIYLR